LEHREKLTRGRRRIRQTEPHFQEHRVFGGLKVWLDLMMCKEAKEPGRALKAMLKKLYSILKAIGEYI
jgi:hypothetical protein